MSADIAKQLELTAAWAQCGDAPPYNCVPVPVRMNGGMPQIQIKGQWINFPAEGPRPIVEKYYGMKVAGIASDWRPI